MEASDWIAIVALVVAFCASLPGFIALRKTRPKIDIAQFSINSMEYKGTQRVVFDFLICNLVNISLSVLDIKLQISKKIFDQDDRVPFNMYLIPYSTQTATVTYYVPMNIPLGKEVRFLIFTNGKIIKSKKLSIPK